MESSVNNKLEVKDIQYREPKLCCLSILQGTQKKFGKARIGENCNSQCQVFDADIHQRTTIKVKWLKPPEIPVKLKSDGSCIRGRYSGGGIIRDSQGTIIMAY